jgi:transcriptional regulator with PAS, ATPase and Fis domain
MIGSSAAMQILREKLDRAVSANQTVLILGENGTGKDLCAKYLHFYHPKRKKGPFVAVNCASIPKQLTESFLFGHVKGAFTGASESAQGVFEQANSGTLFLDEIGELSMDMQAQLLRVIEDGLVRPVGSNKSKAVDVRIVCATNRDIDAERQKKNFRDDLYYRCQNIIRVPSLRERRDDIVSLAKYFLACSAKPLEISDDAFSALQLYPWPGNVRELSSTIEGAILNASFRGSSVITESDLQLQTQLAPTLTKMKVINLLEKHRGNVSEVAAACDVSRKTLYQWMREFEISPTSFRNRSLLSLK